MITFTSMKSILAGVGGTLVLALFCTTFTTLDKILVIMPLFLAFNGALIGFRLVETMKSRLRETGLFSWVMGMGGGAAVFFVVNLAGRMINSPFGLNFLDLAVYLLVPGIASFLGAKLAIKHFNLTPA